MQEKPKTLIVASVVALIGAIIALVEAFMAFDKGGSTDDILLSIGVLLTIAVLFFAILGSFGVYGQWTWRMSMIASFLCAGVIIMAYFYEIFDFAIFLMLIATALLVVLFTTEGKDWMNTRVVPEALDN